MRMVLTISMPVFAKLSRCQKDGRITLDFNPQTYSSSDQVIVHSLASNSALIESDSTLRIADRIEFNFAESAFATILWTSERLAICKFDHPIGQSTLALDTLAQAIGPDLVLGENEHEAGHGPAGDEGGFGERLHRLRIEKGWKQADIADRLGVSIAAVSGWESGRTFPRGARWTELAECLGVQLTQLTGDDADDLVKLVAASRVDIARLARTSPDKIRISIDL